MNESNLSRHYRALELDKILRLLADKAPCADSALLALDLRPTAELNEAQYRLQQTSDAHMLVGRFGTPSFGRLQNMTNAIARAAAGGSLSMRELLDISENLRVLRGLTEWHEHSADIKTSLQDLLDGIFPNKYLENRINTCIISEEEIADSASHELHEIRRKMRAASARVREQLDKMVRSPAYQRYLQDPIVTIRGDRFVVPVKAEFRSEVPGLVHDTSSSGATIFVEPIGSVEANNELKVLRAQEAQEIERILLELSSEVGSFAESLKRSYQIAVELGFLFAKANLAYSMKASLPELGADGVIVLKKARHPLIPAAKVVATDISLGKDFDTLVITGPNTGGKTVALKTVGLLSLMAMCGLMIPAADESRLSVFEHVLADIGDEQSIEQSLSTFSAHMTNIIQIMSEADDSSLVLIDELGAGTDPVEGAALATAILEHLRLCGAKIAATTHYAELKAYALQTRRVENGCCEFDVKTLRPTYRLLIGIPGRSNAFAISERLGMSPEVVERAKELVSTESTRFEDVVGQLEESRQSMEERSKAAEEMRAAAEKAQREANERLQRLKEKQDKEMEAARFKAKTIIDQARRQAELMLEEIDRIRREKDAEDFSARAAQARSGLKSRLREMEAQTDPVNDASEEGEYKLPRALKVGDPVLLMQLGGSRGTVLSLPDSAGNVEVQAGILKTRVPVSSLRLDSNAPKQKPVRSTTRTGTSRVSARALTELDLRGMMADEAVLELDRFLDQCQLNGIEQLTVIHGKGTGALRNAVQLHLRHHPSVKSFRSGMYGEGESGVTIVEMK